MMHVGTIRAMTLPDGSYIEIEDYEGKDTPWRSVDITLVRADGKRELLNSIDFDDVHGLRTLIYDAVHCEPVKEIYHGYGKEKDT